ncbi:MAG TPA: hypothetical protein VMF67_15570 [Rhizomicrobium sp.]|nr:hypothetical protein [Rhizomicrobium sp.]
MSGAADDGGVPVSAAIGAAAGADTLAVSALATSLDAGAGVSGAAFVAGLGEAAGCDGVCALLAASSPAGGAAEAIALAPVSGDEDALAPD